MIDNEKAAKQAERELREMMGESGTGQVEVAEETGLMDEMMARGPVVVTVDGGDGGGSSSSAGMVKTMDELDDDTDEWDLDDMQM
jgi:hypothetical protein